LKTGCIILAGGKGRRLGREKAWVDLGGRSLLQHAVSNFEFLNSEIVIVKAAEGKLPPVSAGVTLKVVQDYVSGKGPMAGILAGLEVSKYRFNMLMACDMPFPNTNLVRYMVALASDYDIVAPRAGKYFEPLMAVYSKDTITEIKKLLAQNMLKVNELFGRVHTRFVESSEIDRFDPDRLSFLNINTPADLNKAEWLLGRS
jgi:molybdenum cofactor guanylyltransferase